MFDKFLSDHKDDKDGMTNEEGEKFRKAFEDPKVGAKKERLQKTLHFPSLPACLPACLHLFSDDIIFFLFLSFPIGTRLDRFHQFREMLADYMDEISDPKYRAETEQYISQLERVSE